MIIAHRRLVATVAVSIIAVVLVGCAEQKPEALPTATPTPTPSETPTRDPFAVPESAFEVACDELVSREEMAVVYGTDIAPITAVYAGVHEWEVDEAAARNDGALVCQWSLPASLTPEATITATAASADEFALAVVGLREMKDSAGERILDGTYGLCREEYLAEPGTAWCTWNLYRDGVWLVASFSDIPDGEVDAMVGSQSLDNCGDCPPPRSDSDSTRIVVEATERVRPHRMEPPARAQVLLATCDEVLDAMKRSLSGTVDFGQTEDLSSFEPGGGRVWGVGSLAIERQGWTRCFTDALVDGRELYFYLTVARDAAWLLTNELPALASFVPMAHGDGVSECAVTEDSGYCTASVAVGPHLIALTAFESGDQQLAEALVLAAADALP